MGTTVMGQGDNGGFSQEQIDMYKECFKLMDVDKDGTLSKSDLRAAFDNVGKLWTRVSSTPCWENLVVHATLTTWSRCSKRRWLVAPTTPMTSSSVPSRHTRSRAKSRLRCSAMLS